MEALNEWLALIVNASVVAGVIFLAFEIRQNTKMSRVQIHTDLVSLGHEHLNWQRDIQFVEVIAKAVNNYEDLSSIERRQFNTYAFQFFNLWEFTEACFNNKLMATSDWKSWDDSFQGRMSKDLWIRAWTIHRGAFSERFQSHVDTVIPKNHSRK